MARTDDPVDCRFVLFSKGHAGRHSVASRLPRAGLLGSSRGRRSQSVFILNLASLPEVPSPPRRSITGTGPATRQCLFVEVPWPRRAFVRRRPQSILTLIPAARGRLRQRGAVAVAAAYRRDTPALAWSTAAGTRSMRTVQGTMRSARKRIPCDAALAPIAQIAFGRAMMRRQPREQHDTNSGWTRYALQEPVTAAMAKYRGLQPS